MMEPLNVPQAGDVDRGSTLIILLSIFSTLSTVTTILRLFARYLKHQFGWDDLAIFIAWILLTIQISFDVLELNKGYGRHAFYLDNESIEQILKWCYVTEILIFLIICITKISICLFVLRITGERWLQWVLYVTIAGLIVTTIPVEIVLFAQCRPLRAYWDRSAGTCWNPAIYNDFIWVQVSFSITSDLICTSLPVILLWNSRIALKMKVAVCSLMSIGLIATACAGIRASLSTRNFSADLPWSLVIITDWGCVETNVAIIGANLALSRSIYQSLHTYFVLGERPGYKYKIDTIQRRPSSGLRGLSFSSILMSTKAHTQVTVRQLDEEGSTQTLDLEISKVPPAMMRGKPFVDGPYEMPYDIHTIMKK